MKLNIDVCQKCCSGMHHGIAFTDDSKGMLIDRGWVRCPQKIYEEIETRLDRQPPTWCDYKLEHAVSEIVNIDKGGGDGQ